MRNFISKTIILNTGEVENKRQEILRYFQSTYDLDEQIYTALKDQDTFYQRADPLRHPLIFYLGHTAVFYVNKLILGKVIKSRINPQFESMFAVGVDEMSWDDLNETHYDWPPVNEVMDYRLQVRNLVENLIMNSSLTLPITWESPFWLVMMGIEHQRIHIETSSVLIRQLPLDKLKSNEIGIACKEDFKVPKNEMIPVKGRKVKLGKKLDDPLYGWDNEYGSHEFEVDDFCASKFLVSNQEFKEFVEDGGYHKKQWWTDEGWHWREFTRAEHPKFWVNYSGKWFLRLVYEEVPMPWSWPVEVNYLEAKAFANWKAEQTAEPVRLPTEDEWYILYNDHVSKDQPFWKNAPGNINLEHYSSPCPVNRFRFDEFFDVIGNVWQWTETPINGFEGFRVHPCYDDFSTPTFDGRHNLIKGGSWISTGNEAIKDSRYAFRRHFFQHAGFRYVISNQPVVGFEDYYEDDNEIIPYCELDYGKEYLGIGNFAQNLADLCLPWHKQHHNALVIGCSVGRSCFEMARGFDHVTGIDFTARLIKVAEKMKSQGKIKYHLPQEGELVSFAEVTLAELGLAESADKVEFWQADASNLAVKFDNYDFILAQNILEKLYDPSNFLSEIYKRLSPKGILVISSTYKWQTEFTDKERQLGGFRKDGEPYYSKEALADAFKGKFSELKKPIDLPLVIRQNARNYLYQIAEVSFWKKY